MTADLTRTEVVTLGGGCFWCLEAVFDDLEGVVDVVSGYCNGQLVDPDYTRVCEGTTGHAEAERIEAIGLAEGAAAKALGLARAEAFEAQQRALGQAATALVAVANAVGDGHINIMPDVLVTGGGGALDGLAATLIRMFSPKISVTDELPPPAP